MKDYILGYGLRKKENLNSSTLPDSFDFFFKDEDEFDDFCQNLNKDELDNKFQPLETITIYDVVITLRDKDYNEDEIINYFNSNNLFCIDEEDLSNIL